MITFTSTIEPLREANWVAGYQAFEWKVLSHDGKAVTASNGLSLNVQGSIADVNDCSMVIVCSSFDPHLYITPKMLTWLRKLDRKGAMIGGVETGAYVLASAGLLDNCRATIHWENVQSVLENFPKVKLSGKIFEIDGRKFSAAGAAAALDMMLHFIGAKLGRHVASGVSEEFIYNRMREAKNPQRLTASERMDVRQPRLKRILQLFDKQLNRRLDMRKVAAAEGISEREMRRLFRVYIGVSPQQYHRGKRLEKARFMLRQTDLSITNVASRCGFASSADFSRAFRRAFRCRPVDDRKEAYVLYRPLAPGA